MSPAVNPRTTQRYARVAWSGQTRYIRFGATASDGAETLDGPPWAGGKPDGTRIAQAVLESPALRLLAPVVPTKIIGIGRNYRAHAAELNNEVPKQPLMFLKPPSSLSDPGAPVLLPPESQRVDYEGELAVVIGKRCRRIAPSEALSAVFGYSIACDVTARDLQKSDAQWTRGKGFDTFCPLGPYVVSGLDASNLELELLVNEQRRQHGRTSDMIFDLASLVSYASAVMTLEPGDLILTGTPEGVGPLVDGDRVQIRIEGLGELAFAVTGEPASSKAVAHVAGA
jgi:2-keto-4-pentenoate hydratase/2-oxohepta-3-ene-1,7-dioic acid hydratase in catechol pathway